MHVYNETANQPVSKVRQVLFTVGNLGWGIFTSITMFFQSAFLLEVAEVPDVWVGNILVVKQVWDGVIDPFIGIASDKLNTRWGRRKPWMITFIWPLFLLWVGMWIVPIEGRWEKSTGVIVYYAAIVFLFSTVGSLVMVPYNAMIPDMATDYHSRTFVVFFTLIFGIIGGSFASILWDTMVNAYSSNLGERQGYFFAAISLGLPIICLMLVSIIAGKERKLEESPYETKNGRKGIVLVKQIAQDLFDIARFPPFLCLLGLNMITQVAGSLYMSNFILWIKYVRLEEDQTSTSLFVIQVSVGITLVFWVFVARLTGKITTYLLSSIFVCGGLLTLFLFPESSKTFYYLNLFCISFGASASGLVTYSLMPDVISMNEEKSGLRREALFYSFFALTSKVAQGLAQLTANYILGFSGYLNPTEQDEQGVTGQSREVIIVMSALVALFPMFLRIIGVGIAVLYSVSTKNMVHRAQPENISLLSTESP